MEIEYILAAINVFYSIRSHKFPERWRDIRTTIIVKTAGILLSQVKTRLLFSVSKQNNKNLEWIKLNAIWVENIRKSILRQKVK